MWLIFNVFFVSSYQVLDVIYEERIIIEKIQINRQRDKVLIYANGNIYYMSYASRHVSKSIRKIKEDLSNGNLSIGDAVDIKFVSADDILFNFIWNKKRIVDLKTDQTSYYTLDTEKKVLKDAKMSMGLLLFLSVLCWLIYTYFIYIIYGTTMMNKSSKRIIHKKYKKS